MPGYHIGVPGGVAGFEAFIQTMPRQCREESVIWDRYWTYQRRQPDMGPQWDQTFIATEAWWPMSKSGGWGGDPTTPTFFSDDNGMMRCGAFAAWEYGLGGSQSRKFIMGQCKQVSGDPYGGAVVYGFKSSDGLPIGSVASDDKGRYELGCPNTPTDNHFLVARAAASPQYAGITVNNIVPTWRDGTV